MSYREMSNREGNLQRIMDMHAANLSPNVIAAYMTDWNVPMSAPDVQGIINTHGPMGKHAVKKTDVAKAIQNHDHIQQILQQPFMDEDDGDQQIVVHVNDDEETASD